MIFRIGSVLFLLFNVGFASYGNTVASSFQGTAPVETHDEYLSDPIDEGIAPEYLADGTVLADVEELREEQIDERLDAIKRKNQRQYSRWFKKSFLGLARVQVYVGVVVLIASIACIWSILSLIYAFYGTDRVVFTETEKLNRKERLLEVEENVEVIISE